MSISLVSGVPAAIIVGGTDAPSSTSDNLYLARELSIIFTAIKTGTFTALRFEVVVQTSDRTNPFVTIAVWDAKAQDSCTVTVPPGFPVQLNCTAFAGGTSVNVNATPANVSASVAVIGPFWPDTQPVSGPLTDTQLRSTPVAVSLSGTMAVTGPLTDTQLRASAVPIAGVVAISGTVPVSLSGSVAVTGPLTDTQLRASAVPVSGTFFQATQPVSGAFFQATQPVSGPLTDTQLRASAVPISITGTVPLPTGAAKDSTLTDSSQRIGGTVAVSGTFFQATQPVSIAASVAVTGTFFQATQPVSIAATVAVSGPLTDTQLRASAVPVSGTFFQATQPVSLAALPALATGAAIIGRVGIDQTTPGTTNKVSIGTDGTVAVSGSVAVTGTFFQATQPVSIAATVAVSGPLTDTQLRASAVPVSVAGVATQTTLATLLADATFTGRINTQGQKTSAASTPVVLASDQSALPVTAPALTKGTQGTNGWSTQDLCDSGRSARIIFLDSLAVAATAETLATISISADNAAPTTGTSYNVTAGKRLRLQSMTLGLHTIAGNTTAVNVIIRIRVNNAGAAVIGSPIQLVVSLPGIATANGAITPINIALPDGWEFVGGAGLGITVTCAGFVANTAAPKVDVSISGFEY